MKIDELPYLIRRRLANQLRGIALRYGLSGTRRFDVRFLFTCMQGIYLYDHGRIRRIVRNQHFGIDALSDDAFVAAEWVTRSPMEKSAVHVYRFDGTRVTGRSEIQFRDERGNRLQPFGIHQIRILNGYLWVANTRENVIWKCDFDGRVLSEWTETRKMPFDADNPARAIAERKADPDYRHYNSIAHCGGHYYVLAHNCTSDHDDLSKRSYIVKLDEHLAIIDRVENVGRASHDLVFVDGALHVCNSREGALLKDSTPLLELGAFLRGVGHRGSMMVIGGSQFEIKRSARESTPSRLFFVDIDVPAPLASVTLGRVGNIRDVLFWDGKPR